MNTESGRTIVTGKFIGYGDADADGALENRGQFEGMVSGEGMNFKNQGTLTGELIGAFQNLGLVGGTLTGPVDASITGTFSLEGGAVNGTVSLSGDTASFKLTGGAITANSGDAALAIEAGDLSNVYFDGGTVTNNGSGSAFKYGGAGTLNYSGGTVFRTRTNLLVAEPAIIWWDPVWNDPYYELQEATGNKITIVKDDDAFSGLSVLVNGTATPGGYGRANPNDTVQITFENTSSDRAYYIEFEAEDVNGVRIADTAGESTIQPGESVSMNDFTMPGSDVTVTVNGDVLYQVSIDRSSTAFRDREDYTLAGVKQETAYIRQGEPVMITLRTGAAETGYFNFEARDADGKLFPDADGRNSYGTYELLSDSLAEFRFVMPAGKVTVTGEEYAFATRIVHLESGTGATNVDTDILYPIDDWTGTGTAGTMILLPGVTTDSFTIQEESNLGDGATDITFIISEDATMILTATILENCSLINNGTIDVAANGRLQSTNSFTNNGKVIIESDGVFLSEPSSTVINASGATFTNNGTETHIGGGFQNDGTISNAEGAIMYLDSDGTLTNNGTIDNWGTFTNNGIFNDNGTFNNYSGHTFNNHGTVILGKGGVIRNGDGAGHDGVFNNFADGGVILNSGTIVNNEGSTFRNYGSIIEETAGAVSPELTDDSVPVVRYGSDCIPEGAVGGQCGDTLFWYLEELEEEEAEKLRHFTEGHTASASDAERAEDDASVSYILHITGSGAMDNFDLDGGNSTAPWFEELDGVVRAVKIDAGVTQIGKNAFYGICTLAYVSFAGTDTEWKSVKVQSGNEALDKTVLLFGGDDDLVLGDPLLAEDEEVSWTEPEAKPAAAAADKPAAGKATASDAEKEEQEGEKKEEGDTEQKPETPETPWAAEPESRKPEETESGKSGNGKQDSEA